MVQFSIHSSVIANKTIVHEDVLYPLFTTDILDSEQELNSELSQLSHDISIIVKSLNRLNIEPDILIDVLDIDFNHSLGLNDLD